MYRMIYLRAISFEDKHDQLYILYVINKITSKFNLSTSDTTLYFFPDLQQMDAFIDVC